MDLKVLGKLAQALDWSPANNNSRFIPHELPGGKWGIWDMQSGGTVSTFDKQHQANNYSQWLNYSGGHDFGY